MSRSTRASAAATGPAASIAAACRLVQPVVERTSFGATVSGEGCEHADLVEVVADVVDGGFGGGERRSGGGELADGVVELAVSVGRLTVEDVLVGWRSAGAVRCRRSTGR